MLANVCSAAVNGIQAHPAEVEVNAGYGDIIIVIVGLPDAAVKESRDRVMTAPINSGFSFAFGRTTINLAPADVKKEGLSFDLPIAIGMAAASEQAGTDQLEKFMVVGELALDGAVRPGIFAGLLHSAEERRGFRGNALQTIRAPFRLREQRNPSHRRSVGREFGAEGAALGLSRNTVLKVAKVMRS